jgi:D-galacturonate reductase
MPGEPERLLRVGMVGMGMIFDETYRPTLEKLHRRGLWTPETGRVAVELAAVASKTGRRAEKYRQQAADRIAPFVSVTEPDAVKKLLEVGGGCCLRRYSR